MEPIRYGRLPGPLGTLLAVDHGSGLSGLYFPEHRRGPQVDAAWVRDDDAFRSVAGALDAYFAGSPDAFDGLTPHPRGTDFQREVWTGLGEVGYGSTVTYGQLAAHLGRPRSVRAVASAVARNPLAVIVPCHRVIGGDGSLTGFAGGLERKRLLLAIEAGTSATAAIGAHGTVERRAV